MLKKTLGAALVLWLPLASIGQVKEKKVYELIYDDVQALKQQVEQLRARLDSQADELRTLSDAIREIADLLRRAQADQTGIRDDLRAVPVQYQTLSERLDQLSLQLVKIAADLAVLRPSAPAGEEGTPAQAGAEKPPAEAAQAAVPPEKPADQAPVPPPVNISPQDAYNAAYNDYLRGNYDLAVASFRLYREQFPASPLADNALYWIGESFFSQRKFEEAIAEFNGLILDYPQGDRIPAAYLKKGLAYMEMGKKEEALAALKLLTTKYPLAEESRIAQEKMKELTDR
ncbi:MAG: tol-pal system protein YbgF [Candidatus Aminicenantes bacterium]|nr:tol-pal system protein YbgF [Candidatus Aminicenantes bacterium]